MTEDEFMSLKPGDLVHDDSAYGISWIALNVPSKATGYVEVLIVGIALAYYESLYPVGSRQLFGSHFNLVSRPSTKIVRLS